MIRLFWLTFLLLLCSCTSLFYQPDRYLYANPKKLGISFENVYFHAPDQTKLHGWYMHNKLDAKKPKGLIIHFHGNAQNMSSHFLNLAWILDHGYDLFVFDYRGYGTSEGKPDKDGVFQDSLSALNKAFELAQQNKVEQFIIFGQSLGGALATRSFYDFTQKEKVKLLVLDSTFMNYKKVAAQALQRSWLTWLFHPLAFLVISNKYATEEIVPKITVPTLVIHGKLDRVVNFSNGEEIYRKLEMEEKFFWPLEKGRHIDVFNNKPDRIRQRFLDLLSNLRR